MSTYFYDQSEELDLGGATSRYRHNLTAIRTLKAIQAEGRPATPDEQRLLSYYSGWGDSAVMKQALEAPDFQAILTPEEWTSLKGSTLNAHFTTLPIIRRIWDALEHLGFGNWAHPRLVDPSAGSGRFISAMPPELYERCQPVEVELDQITAGLLALLHPDHTVHACGFEAASLPQEYFDAFVSNIPFGDYPVIDDTISEHRMKASIHDYFFVKAMQLLRPGGILAFITSRYTLDKHDFRCREWLAERADLLAAVRLPEGTFRHNAGTDVVVDILFLRKRMRDEKPVVNPGWVATDLLDLPGDGIDENQLVNCNRIYLDHPDWVLGTHALSCDMHAIQELTVKPDGRNVSDALCETLLRALPKDLITGEQEPATVSLPPRPTGPLPLFFIHAGLSESDRHRIERLRQVYEIAKRMLQLEIDSVDPATIAKTRQALNEAYDTFVLYHGPINSSRNVRALRNNAALPFLKALETDYEVGPNTAKKAALFTRTTVRGWQVVRDIRDAREALVLSLDTFGEVNLCHIANLLGVEADEAARQLKGQVYLTPQDEWQTADEYLSGDIKAKLADATAAAALNPALQANVEALQAVYPLPLKPGDIMARLGSNWIPTDVIALFLNGLVPGLDATVNYVPRTGQWFVTTEHGYALHSITVKQRWSTPRRSILELFDDALNSRSPLIFDEIDDKKVLNRTETTAAVAKLAEIKATFEEWVWKDADRAERLARSYNDRFNTTRVREYDGSHLSLPGVNSAIDLRKRQKSGVWRILQSRATLLGHVVGAGKTLTIACAMMELIRLGLAHKCMVVVPNHLTEQWLKEILWAYPSANVLCCSKDDFTRERRGEFLSRIATENWDIVIVPLSSFKLLPVSSATLIAFTREQLLLLEDYLWELKREKAPQSVMKDIQKTLKRYQEKLHELTQIAKDSTATITWEELGIDVLAVDEAHYYKNLHFITKMTRIAGLPNTQSERAMDLFIKVRWLMEHGRRVVFATGTPVANTMAEVYTMMRFLQLDLLREKNLDHFDGWASMFGEAVPSMEMTPDGSGFRMNTRFAKFINLPELLTMWRQVLDICDEGDIASMETPILNGGKPQPVQLPGSDELKQFVKSLAKRVDRIKKGDVMPWQDNMLLITSEGRKAALSPRLVMSGLPVTADTKLIAIADNVAAIFHATREQRGTQIIFCDGGTPKSEHVTDRGND